MKRLSIGVSRDRESVVVLPAPIGRSRGSWNAQRMSSAHAGDAIDQELTFRRYRSDPQPDGKRRR
jgi:hypothetical protein